MLSICQTIISTFSAEQERWPLWLPVFVAIGIALYFSLLSEPSLLIGAVSLTLVLISVAVLRGRPRLQMLGIVLAVIAVGFTSAQIRTASTDTSLLNKKTGPIKLAGFVARTEVRGSNVRLTLERVVSETQRHIQVPSRIRLTVRGFTDVLPGDWIQVRAILRPPPSPAAPGAFDFRRYAFFERIGAVGFSLGPLRQIQTTPPSTVSLWLARWRSKLTKTILDSAEGPSGAVAAALITGERGAVPEQVMTNVRGAGLAHLLAISGLHMALVAGTLFFAVRALLATSESLTLRFPVKKWAALAALAGAFVYLLISGATVPTQRAFIMTSLVLLAVCLDRKAISMRLVAWAALGILLLTPESLLSASFQMSFAAVVALVAVYETLSPRMAGGRRGIGIPHRLGFYFLAASVTTIVAGSATAPFAAYHFNTFVSYGLIANLFAVPLMAFWIMPWGVISVLLVPLGWQAFALSPMTLGIDAILWIAATVSDWPGAVRLVPTMPVASLAMLTIGGLWLCLWRQKWRHFGWISILMGLATAGSVRPPDILVDGDARLFAVRSNDGGLLVSNAKTAKFVSKVWLRRSGEGKLHEWPWKETDTDRLMRCDTLGCVYQAGRFSLAFPIADAALIEDCAVADVIISKVPVRGGCPHPHTVIDRFDLWRNGAYALWINGNKVRVENVRDHHGSRPWSATRDLKKEKGG